ncbi:MAG: hypothetical protein WCI02_02665 [Planctomycetota bacterium]
MSSAIQSANPLQVWLRERLSRGCNLLFAAYEYSQTCRCDRCQLAITLEELFSAGIDCADCRWMVVEGIIEHFTETTYPGDKTRSFRQGDALLTKQSAFMLTQYGVQFIRCEFQLPVVPEQPQLVLRQPDPPLVPPLEEDPIPNWDASRHELWFDGRLIKQYRIPSANQTTILAAFEEDGWPPRIDDPLPFHCDIDSRRRLNDTIRNLNRSRIHPILRFAGDGSGEGILWEANRS